MIREIGYSDFLGQKLATRIEESFRMAEMTPTLAKQDIDTLAGKINELKTAIDQGLQALPALSIGAEDLEPGRCELGFMIPPSAIDRRLEKFASECKTFDLIFGTFSEIVTGKREHYRINTISSSDFSIFLDSGLATVVAIGIAAERLLAAYKQLLDIRKLRSELAKADVPKTAFKQIDDHATSKMKNTISEVAAEIMNKYASALEPARKNELENALTISFSKLANRIDQGYHIEVRVGALPEPLRKGRIQTLALAASRRKRPASQGGLSSST